LQEGQEESEGNQTIFGGFSKFVTQRSFVTLLVDFSIIESNNQPSILYNNIKRITGVILYRIYAL
jgi:hypothetical protein